MSEGEGGWIGGSKVGVDSGKGSGQWAVDMGTVCMVVMDASAGMSNDETTQKRKEK